MGLWSRRQLITDVQRVLDRLNAQTTWTGLTRIFEDARITGSPTDPADHLLAEYLRQAIPGAPRRWSPQVNETRVALVLHGPGRKATWIPPSTFTVSALVQGFLWRWAAGAFPRLLRPS